jgi:hypothetical protein
MKFFYKISPFLFCAIFYFWASPALAAPDADHDRVSDEDEIKVYYTNPDNPDTDGDGFDDYAEIKSGYSPRVVGKKFDEVDYDEDGLNDRLERLIGTDLGNPDTDGDGSLDGKEIYSGFDPRNSDPAVRYLAKRIQIGIKEQKLRMSVGTVILAEYPVSTGTLQYPTPLGAFKIDNKANRAWSARWGLWMPWWMSLRHGNFGIHELPEWPGGKKEGENHLGHRVSHGCIRLGVGPAKMIYDWADLGTPVQIQQSLYGTKVASE